MKLHCSSIAHGSLRFALIVGLASIFAASILPGCASGPVGKRIGESDDKHELSRLIRAGDKARDEGNFAGAERHYRAAVTRFPTRLAAVKRLTKLLTRTNQVSEAISIGKRYVESVPGDPGGYYVVAEAQIAARELGPAEKTLAEVLLLDEKDPRMYELRGRLLLLRGKNERGMADLREAVRIAPRRIRFRMRLASALFGARKLGEAALHLRAALQIEPEHARAHLLLGILLRDQFEFREALSHHLKAAQFAPESARAHYQLGVSQWKYRDPIGASQSLALATKLAPNKAHYFYTHGEVLRGLKRFSEAAQAYRSALDLDSNLIQARVPLGVCLFYLERYSQAESMLTTAARERPQDPYPYFNLGNVYDRTARPKMAIAAFRKFVELAPRTDADIATARKKIAKLRRQIRRR